MRRPLLIVLIFMSLGILFAYYIKTSLITVGALLTVCSLVFFMIKNKYRHILLYVMAVFIIGYLLMYMQQSKEVISHQYQSQEVTVTGQIQQIQSTNSERYSIIIKANQIEETQINENIIVYAKEYYELPESIIGQTVKIKGELTIPNGKRNPNTFDYRLYLKTREIYSVLYTTGNQIKVVEEQPQNIRRIIGAYKYTFEKIAKEKMSKETAGLMIGMLFGEKDAIEKETYTMFQKHGIAHIIAVSGLHVGVIFGFLMIIIRIRKKEIKNIIILSLLIAYLFMANFTPSVIRAITMIIMYMFGKQINRKYDLITALAITGILFLFINPYNLFNVSFQLSFVVVLIMAVIIAWGKRLSLEKWKQYILAVFAAQAGSIPIVSYYFNQISVWAWLLNIPVIFLAGLIIPISFLLLITYKIDIVIIDWVFGICELFIEVMLYIINLFNQLPLYHIKVNTMPIISVIGIYGLVLWLFYDFSKNAVTKYKRQVSIFMGIAIIITLTMTSQINNPYEIVFVDVGQGDSIHIRTANHHILIDSGGNTYESSYNIGENVLLPYLLKNGVNEIDYMIISHLHKDHYQGIIDVADQVEVKNYILSETTKQAPAYNTIKDTALNNQSQIQFVNKSDVISIEKDVWIEVLYPNASQKNVDYGDGNNASLVLLLNYMGTKVLLTGDIEYEVEEVLVNNYKNLDIDILKIPHHGSLTSSTEKFIYATDPEYGIIQVGNNIYGLPRNEILKRYEEYGTNIYTTKEQGAILVNITDKEYEITSVIGGK